MENSYDIEHVSMFNMIVNGKIDNLEDSIKEYFEVKRNESLPICFDLPNGNTL